MNDLFDQQITDGLHRAAAGITVHHGSLPDVRRRVRARRARHVAAVSLPAVAGLALVGLRQTPTPSPLSPAAAPEPSAEPTTVSSDPGPDTGVPTPSSPTSTTTVESTIPGLPTSTTTVESTMSAYPIDGVVCLDATPDASAERCLATLPGARTMTAPSYVVIKDTPMFVVPADPAYQAEAQALSDRLGLPFRPDITGHFQQDLAGIDLTGVRVFVVLGTTDTTVCTIPNCSVSETTLPDLDQALGEQVAHAADVFRALGFPVADIIAHGDDKVQLRSLDPDNPDARHVTLTIARAALQEQGAPVTTIGALTRQGSTSVVVQHGPWLYELDVVDAFGGPLPTGDELVALLHRTFGGSLG